MFWEKKLLTKGFYYSADLSSGLPGPKRVAELEELLEEATDKIFVEASEQWDTIVIFIFVADGSMTFCMYSSDKPHEELTNTFGLIYIPALVDYRHELRREIGPDNENEDWKDEWLGRKMDEQVIALAEDICTAVKNISWLDRVRISTGINNLKINIYGHPSGMEKPPIKEIK